MAKKRKQTRRVKTRKMKFDDLVNPFVIDKPIKESGFFIGRKKETEIIDKILTNTRKKKYQNCLIIGKRSIGKTSLLNYAHIQAQKKNLLTIRFDLDETAVDNPIDFFETLVLMILNEAKQKKIFNYHDRFVKALSNTKVEANFPLQIANFRLSSGKNRGRPVPYYIVKNDLEWIHKKMDGKIDGIVLMFDEADIFLLNKSILQILRNVFQHTDGYIVMMACTENLLDDINYVFSPIPRFFIKIMLGPYKDTQECIDAVIKPLESTEGLISVNNRTIDDLIVSANRVPYHINLLGYFGFERSVSLRKKELIIDDNVFDSVREQKQEIFIWEKRFKSLKFEYQDILCCLSFAGGIASDRTLAFLASSPEELETIKVETPEQLISIKEIIKDLIEYQTKGDEKPLIKSVRMQTDTYEFDDLWLDFFIKYVVNYQANKYKFTNYTKIYLNKIENIVKYYWPKTEYEIKVFTPSTRIHEINSLSYPIEMLKKEEFSIAISRLSEIPIVIGIKFPKMDIRETYIAFGKLNEILPHYGFTILVLLDTTQLSSKLT